MFVDLAVRISYNNMFLLLIDLSLFSVCFKLANIPSRYSSSLHTRVNAGRNIVQSYPEDVNRDLLIGYLYGQTSSIDY